MPCQSGPSYDDVERDRKRASDALLCSACRSLEQLGFDFDTNPELSRFWADHKVRDADRIRKENEKRLIQEQVDVLLAKSIKELTEQDRAFLNRHGGYSFPIKLTSRPAKNA